MIFEFYIKYKNKKEISYSTECVFLFLFYVNIFASTQKKSSRLNWQKYQISWNAYISVEKVLNWINPIWNLERHLELHFSKAETFFIGSMRERLDTTFNKSWEKFKVTFSLRLANYITEKMTIYIFA